MNEEIFKNNIGYLKGLSDLSLGVIDKDVKYIIKSVSCDNNKKIILDYMKLKNETKLRHPEICKKLNISTYRFNRIMKDNEIDSFYRHPVPNRQTRSKKTKKTENPEKMEKPKPKPKSKPKKEVVLASGKLDSAHESESEHESGHESESTTTLKQNRSSRIEKFQKELLAAGLNGKKENEED